VPVSFAAVQISSSYRGVKADLKNAECAQRDYAGRISVHVPSASHSLQGKVPSPVSPGREAAWGLSSTRVVCHSYHTEALLLDSTTDSVPEASRKANGNSSGVTVV